MTRCPHCKTESLDHWRLVIIRRTVIISGQESTVLMIYSRNQRTDSETHLLNSNRSFSKMRMGPVELRMMRGWPPKRQKTVPAKAVPRKLSITPYWKRECGRQTAFTGDSPNQEETELKIFRGKIIHLTNNSNNLNQQIFCAYDKFN